MKTLVNINNLSTYIIKFLVWVLILYGLGFALWTVFATETGNGDNVEHLHATWLIAYGKIPYKDFFQHHNPLLWYVFSPFMYLSTNVKQLLDMAYFIGICGGIITFYIVFKTSVRFFASTYASLISLLIMCPPYYYIFCFNYNPDTFMSIFYALGIYQLFCYWEKPRLQTLCISFISFFIAFMFTQKILMSYCVLGCITLYVFYLQKNNWCDLLLALVLPLLGLLLFVAYLYHHNALALYWKSNYAFNVRMQDYYGNNRINVADYQMLICSACCSLISIICFFKSQNKFFRIVSCLFIIELLLRCFYFSIAPYYMLPLMIYMGCLNSVLLENILKKGLFLIIPILSICVYYAYISIPQYLATRGTDRNFVNFITRNLTPCDYLISSYFGNQSIITKDPHYYWAMLGHIDIVGSELNISPEPDLNKLVEKYKPKLIYGGEYWNSYAKNRGEDIIWQKISSDIIDQYYLPTAFPDFYILKYEYRKKECYYDTITKEWTYRY